MILRERPFQQLVSLLRTHLVHQIDGHVVGRRERTAQRKSPGRSKSGDLGRVGGALVGGPQHDRMALDIDASTPRAAGELRVLPRGQRHVLLAIELDQALQHHRAGGHVDPQSQCLRGEYSFDQAGGEQLLHGVTKDRQHACMMGSQTAKQCLAPLVEVQHDQIGVAEVSRSAVDDFGDTTPLLLGG